MSWRVKEVRERRGMKDRTDKSMGIVLVTLITDFGENESYRVLKIITNSIHLLDELFVFLNTLK